MLQRRPTRPPANVYWATALVDSFGLPPPSATDVRFHANGQQALEALRDVLESARARLDITTFLLHVDDLGREVLARLTQRAKAGLAVRLLLDGAGAWLATHPRTRVLRA